MKWVVNGVVQAVVHLHVLEVVVVAVMEVVKARVCDHVLSCAFNLAMEHVKEAAKQCACNLVMALALAVAQGLPMLNGFIAIFTLLRDCFKGIRSEALLYIDAWGNNFIILRNISSGNIIVKEIITPSSIKLNTIVRDFLIEPNEEIVVTFSFLKRREDLHHFLIKVNDIKRNHYLLINYKNNKTPMVDLNIFHVLKFLMKW